MKPILDNRLIRWKAVWGPKRVLPALFLSILCLAPSTAIAKPHSHEGAKKKAGVPNANVKQYRLDDELAQRSNDRNPNNVTRVIVTLLPGAQLPPEFKKFARNGKLALINGQVLDLPHGMLKRMSEHPSVFRVHYDRPIKTHNYRTSVTVGARAVQQWLGYTGAGIGIAVIDSGISSWHDDLTNKTSTLYPYGNQRVTKFVDFVNGRTLPYDDNGHGSHVAGIIAGNGYDSYGEKTGIAPGAAIISLKVLDAQGQGTISNIIAALGWVAANATTYNIRVVNMSVGARIHESYWTDPLTLAAKAVTDKGIVVVTAAGNMGKNSLGHLQWGGISAPANAPWVLTVGASSTMGTLTRSDDTMASFSSSGPSYLDFEAKPDLVAPGTGTISLAVPGSTFYATKAQYLLQGTRALGVAAYVSLSGTSMAAPVVSGTVALMLQANPNLTPNLVKALLQYTAQPYPGYSALRQGAGFLNTLGAVRLAKYYVNPQEGEPMPAQSVWSRQINRGSHTLRHGIIKPSANAWKSTVVWGSAKTLGDDGDNIVWGTADGDNIVWGTSLDAVNNIVWGTTVDTVNNIVWGTDCGGADCDNIVWGTADGDNIVWGTAADGDNVVWGTADGDNIVWGTSADADVTWGSSSDDTVVFSDDTTEPVPDPALEFGDVTTTTVTDAVTGVITTTVTNSLTGQTTVTTTLPTGGV